VQIDLLPGVRRSKAHADMESVWQWADRMVGLLHRWRERPEVAALEPDRELAKRRGLTVDEAIALGTKAINLRRKLSEATP